MLMTTSTAATATDRMWCMHDCVLEQALPTRSTCMYKYMVRSFKLSFFFCFDFIVPTVLELRGVFVCLSNVLIVRIRSSRTKLKWIRNPVVAYIELWVKAMQSGSICWITAMGFHHFIQQHTICSSNMSLISYAVHNGMVTDRVILYALCTHTHTL